MGISSLIIGAMGLGGTALAGTAGVLGHRSGMGSLQYGPAGMMGTPVPGGMMGNGGFVNMWTNCYPGGPFVAGAALPAADRRGTGDMAPPGAVLLAQATDRAFPFRPRVIAGHDDPG